MISLKRIKVIIINHPIATIVTIATCILPVKKDFPRSFVDVTQIIGHEERLEKRNLNKSLKSFQGRGGGRFWLTAARMAQMANCARDCSKLRPKLPMMSWKEKCSLVSVWIRTNPRVVYLPCQDRSSSQDPRLWWVCSVYHHTSPWCELDLTTNPINNNKWNLWWWGSNCATIWSNFSYKV